MVECMVLCILYSIMYGGILSLFISVWSSCLEIGEFPDRVHWSAP